MNTGNGTGIMESFATLNIGGTSSINYATTGTSATSNQNGDEP